MSIFTNTAVRRKLRKPAKPNQPQSFEVDAAMARESLLNFANSVKSRFTDTTTINTLVDECSANVTLVGDGFIVSLIYQKVKP